MTTNRDSAAIQGLWCNNLHHCIYFNEINCILDKAKVSSYKQISDNEYETYTESEDNHVYDIEINSDTLRIKVNSDHNFREYFKTQQINSIHLKELYYSQATDFRDFNFRMNADNNYLLEVNYYQGIPIGKYGGIMKKELREFLSSLIKQMDISISEDLNPRIDSDVQEWAVRIRSIDNKEFSLYHNYSAIDEHHKNFALAMNFLPIFLELEEVSFENELEEIMEFRKSEFTRNLKLNDL